MTRTTPTAWVTGGSRGIGFAIVRALLARDWKVSFSARNAEGIRKAQEQLGQELPGCTERLFARPADVSSLEDVRTWVRASAERFGPPGLLVNNAGIGAWGEIASMSEQTWNQVMTINLTGPFLCTREALPYLRRAEGAWIVNIASLAGKRGFAGASAYCASKFGLVGFTECLAREEAPNGIRAAALCPGYVATPMVADADVPASEMIQPDDVARTVLYLLDLGPNAVVREVVLERIGSL